MSDTHRLHQAERKTGQHAGCAEAGKRRMKFTVFIEPNAETD